MKNKKLIEGLKNDNIKIILSIVVFILISVPIIMNIKKPDTNKNDYNKKDFFHKEEKILKEETIEGIKISNIEMHTKNGQTTFKADATNVSRNDTNIEYLDIELLDKKGKVVITLKAYIPDGLKKNETKIINASAKGEFKNVVSKVIKK